MSQVDLLQTREPGRIVDSVFLLLRQTEWGARNGETRVEMHVVEESGSDYLSEVGIADRRVLLSLAHAALTMAGEDTIAGQIVLENRPSATRGTAQPKATRHCPECGSELDRATGTMWICNQCDGYSEEEGDETDQQAS